MAKHARYTRILVDQYDFSSDSNGLVTTIASDPIDTTCFQATAKESIQGFAGGTIAHNGYYVPAAGEGELEKEMYDRIGVAADVVSALYGTDDDDCPAFVIPATYADQWNVEIPVADAITVKGNWNGGSGIRRGKRVWAGTFNATGEQTSPGYIDLGAEGTEGGFAYLHVQAITGSPTDAAITVESDDNAGFSSPETEGTFTVNEVGAQGIVLSGTVGRYVRLNCTDLGGATAITVVGIVCVSGVTT